MFLRGIEVELCWKLVKYTIYILLVVDYTFAVIILVYDASICQH